MKLDKKSAGKSPQKKKPRQPTPRQTEPARPLLTADQYIDLVGYVLIALAALTILSALSPGGQGDLTRGWLDALKHVFGWGVWMAPILMGLIGVYLVLRRFGDRFLRLAAGRIVGVTLGYLAALATLQILGMGQQPIGQALADSGMGGGYIGLAVVSALVSALGNIGAVIVLIVLWAVALMLAASVSVAQIVDAIQRYSARRAVAANDRRHDGAGRDVIVPPYDNDREGDELVINGLQPRRNGRKVVRPSETDKDIPAAAPASVPAAAKAANLNPSDRRKDAPLNPPTTASAQRMPPPRIIGGNDPLTANAPSSAARPIPVPPQQPTISSRLEIQRTWELPNVEAILEPGNDAALKEADIRKRAQVIEETLNAFGVPGRVVEVNRGPTITQFGVEPGFIELKGGKQVKVKVSRIAGLADDLALALAAPRIRIEAPVPGRAIVGVEVPNGETSLVSLRDVMESDEFAQLAKKTPLRLGLGQDVSGHPVIADLTAMPHLLIAGTTGSGKSVCVNSIIAALLCYNSPEALRLLMVDPKRVELTGYNGIPHLIAPVVVDLEKVTAVLTWTTREMESRYRTFAKHGARNIVDFNQKVSEFNGPVRPDDLKKLPYIVVLIDELADLMMLAPDETEKTICRLAQMARATGIHLIIATQRPSVDVVTGLIKANFPARIAFTVATSVDSRVILDTTGAEKLLGRGDMLVVTPEASLPTRAQGCFVSNEEINRIVRHWRAQVGGDNAGRDPISAAMTAPSIPMTGTLDGQAHPAPVADLTGNNPLTWDEARALTEAASETNSNGGRDDKLFQDAVATVRLQGKASISLLQRRLRIGYTRAARLIEQMEERGIVGPNLPGEQFREVLKMRDDDLTVE
ncbi:MAG: DNA translocase FtsK [Chloroflexi bacterium]|nr:DNA translocase FtsK [Chloroflexota bacterium]MCL5274454.1 DNA translocase FtsK [Chloroflexota bacterium]